MSSSSEYEEEEEEEDPDSDFDPDVVDVTNKPPKSKRKDAPKKPAAAKKTSSAKTQPKKRKLSSSDDDDDDEPTRPSHAATVKVMKEAPVAPPKKKTPRKKKQKVREPEVDSYDILLPSHKLLAGNSGECTVLVQIDEEDASTLDFTGQVGSVGRIETDGDGIVLDLKGCRYRGRIFPGPTAMVLSVANASNFKKAAAATEGAPAMRPQLKVDGLTDEFCRLEKTGNAMSGFDAVVQGEIGGYRRTIHHDDEDVNRNVKQSSATEDASGQKQGAADKKKRAQPAKKAKKSKSKTS